MRTEESSGFEPHLLALSGEVRGLTFVLNDELLIGRNAESIPLADRSVSRRHCLIVKTEAGFVVKDLGSHNGTFVNGEPVGERILEHGDQILIGDSEFQFLATSEQVPVIPAKIPFDDQAVDLTDTIALRGARSMYLQSESELAVSLTDERCRRDTAALLRIATIVNGGDSSGLFHNRLMDSILEVIPADCAAILLTTRDGDFESITLRGLKGRQALSRTIVDGVLRDRTAVMTNRTAVVTDSLASAEVRALLCVPLTVVNRVIGVIYLVRTRNENKFDDGQLQLLLAIAAIAASPLENSLQFERLRRENNRLQTEVDAGHQLIGNSEGMKRVHRFISRVCETDSTVLIAGESGTGKELVARAIQRLSSRHHMPFITVNCAAMTETLVESELFGHEKGAFTGAVSQNKGKFESADGGTIFLDEVGELPLTTQSKLLRVLQERELTRLGNSRTIKINVRVIAATNRDLESDVRNGRFRKDLFYRLNVVTVSMPPLRERREDILPLADYFVARSGARCKRQVKGISPEAATCLLNHDWPGNIRELENAIERAVVLGLSDTILLEDLPEALLDRGGPISASARPGFHDAVRDAKAQIIRRALEECDGNHQETAKLLGLNRTYLHRLIRSLL